MGCAMRLQGRAFEGPPSLQMHWTVGPVRNAPLHSLSHREHCLQLVGA